MSFEYQTKWCPWSILTPTAGMNYSLGELVKDKALWVLLLLWRNACAQNTSPLQASVTSTIKHWPHSLAARGIKHAAWGTQRGAAAGQRNSPLALLLFLLGLWVFPVGHTSLSLTNSELPWPLRLWKQLPVWKNWGSNLWIRADGKNQPAGKASSPVPLRSKELKGDLASRPVCFLPAIGPLLGPPHPLFPFHLSTFKVYNF